MKCYWVIFIVLSWVSCYNIDIVHHHERKTYDSPILCSTFIKYIQQPIKNVVYFSNGTYRCVKDSFVLIQNATLFNSKLEEPKFQCYNQIEKLNFDKSPIQNHCHIKKNHTSPANHKDLYIINNNHYDHTNILTFGSLREGLHCNRISIYNATCTHSMNIIINNQNVVLHNIVQPILFYKKKKSDNPVSIHILKGVYSEIISFKRSRLEKLKITAEDGVVLNTTMHIHLKHAKSIIHMQNLNIIGNITLHQEGRGYLHIRNVSLNRHHLNDTVNVTSGTTKITESSIDHSLSFYKKGSVYMDTNKITGSTVFFEKGVENIHISNNDIKHTGLDTFTLYNATKVSFFGNKIENYGKNPVITFHHPVTLSIQNNTITGQANTIFLIYDYSRYILIENNYVVLSSMATCNPSNQFFALSPIVQNSVFSLDSFIVRNNTVVFNQINGTAYYIPFLQYIPFYFQDGTFIQSANDIYASNPGYYNTPSSRERDLIKNYVLINIASANNIFQMYGNTIYINRINPFDENATLCQTSKYTTLESLLISNKISEKYNVTQSFIWIHFIPTFSFSSMLIYNNNLIVNAVSTTTILYNPHSIGYSIANSFVFIHGYSNSKFISIQNNSISVTGNVAKTGTSNYTQIRANIRRGIFLTDNMDAYEQTFVNIFNLSLLVQSKQIGNWSQLILPYEYMISYLSQSNTLLSFPYGFQIEPLFGDMYNGTDECNYICNDASMCDACYLTDSVTNPILPEFSTNAVGICFNKEWYSDVYSATTTCKHSKLKITGPTVNLVTLLFSTDNQYDQTLHVTSRDGNRVVFKLNDNMIMGQEYANIMYSGSIARYSPYIIYPYKNGIYMKELSFSNIAFVVDVYILINNKIIFTSIFPNGASMSMDKIAFDNCSFTGVQIPFLSNTYYTTTILNINNLKISQFGTPSLGSIGIFEFVNNYVDGVKDIISDDDSLSNNDGIFKNLVIQNNIFSKVMNGLLNLEFAENIIFDNNVCSECVENQFTGFLVTIAGYTPNVCLSYCSVQNNNMNISSQIIDTQYGTSIFNIYNIANPLIIFNNSNSRNLYYGILYSNLYSFPCDFYGRKLMKIMNLNTIGVVYDISCGTPSTSCVGLGCVVNLALIPDSCTVNKSVLISDSSYYFSQFPTIQIAIDVCKMYRPRIIYILPDIYKENIVIQYTDRIGVMNDTISLIGILDSYGNNPVIIGNNHQISNYAIDLTVTIQNLFFINGNGVFDPYIGINGNILRFASGSFLENIYIQNNVFFGAVFYNDTVIDIPSTLVGFYNVIDKKYNNIRGIINPCISNVNIDTFIALRAGRAAVFSNNFFVGSNKLAIYTSFATSKVVDWSIGKVSTVIDNNIGENIWGSFIQAFDQFNLNITNNKCTYFCGAYSLQTTYYEIVKIAFWSNPLPKFINTYNEPLYSLQLLGNTITAGIDDLPVNNPLFSIDRIANGSPFASTNIVTVAVSIISALTLKSSNFKSFKIKKNKLIGYPAAMAIVNLDKTIEINLNEPIGNIPLYDDSVRYLREIQLNNGNFDISGLFVDIQSAYPVTTGTISTNLYCNRDCPPIFTSIYRCRINNAYSILNNPLTFGITDFSTIKSAVYYCPYNRAVFTSSAHYENIDLTSLNYINGILRNIPTPTVFLLESDSNVFCVIYGFQHKINQINDYTSSNYITSIQFNNVGFKMFVTTSNNLPLQFTPCFTNSDSNNRFSSIFYMYVSNPSAALKLANFQITSSTFTFEVGDSNDHQTLILNRILVCPNQSPSIIAFNCEQCLVGNFLFSELTFNSIDSVGQPYKTIDYSLNGISIRLPSSSFTTNINLITLINIININVIVTKSYSTRRFIELINVQQYVLNNINVQPCNPNPFRNSQNVTSTDNYACIFVKSVQYPSLSVFFDNSALAQPTVQNLNLGSIYTTIYAQDVINIYNPAQTGTSGIPYLYTGFQWNVDVNTPVSPYNSFYFNAMVFNITSNTVSGNPTSNIQIGIEIKGNDFSSLFSCTDFSSQIAPISNATQYGYRDTYYPMSIVSILNNNNPNSVGSKLNNIIIDQTGSILKAIYNPDAPGSGTFSCFSCGTGCTPQASVTVFNRVFLIITGFVLFVFFIWLTFGFGCRFFMATTKWISAYDDAKRMGYQNLLEIRGLNNKLEIINNTK